MKIYNYENKAVEISIDFNKVDEITVTILSGDEVLDILYLDGSSEQFDSSNDRITNYFDGTYIPYSVRRGINFLDKWIERTDSYDGIDIINKLRSVD